VVNAGGGSWNTVEEMSTDQWRDMIGTNLDGAFHTVHRALPLLRANPWAQLIGISSDSAQFSFPTRGAYCAAKAGLASLLETVRRETRDTGLRVSTVSLSRVDTYFRGKQPGTRPEALSIEDAALVVSGIFTLPWRVEIRDIEASAITSTFGPYPEHCGDREGPRP
jgi:NAD(P)-dependent dehydrogenase (short-subunit alcohol dehydrogenase family)